jgi:hypothetical protein
MASIEGPVGQSAGALDRDLAQDRRMHELVDETHLEGLLRADVPPGEDHVERALEPDQPRQPLGTAGAGNETELHLGEREHGLGMIGRDAVVAGERGLEPAAEAGAVNRRDDGDAEQMEPLE